MIGTSQFGDQKRVGWDGLDMLNEKMKWRDCVKNDMESLGLSQKDAQSRNKWRRMKGATG